MRNIKAIALALFLSLASTGAFAQCGTQAPANKFCGNDSGAQALAGWKSIPPGALSAIAGGTVLGNRTGASAVPTAATNPVLGIPGTSTGEIGLAGSTSGTAILRAQAAAGSAVSLLPTSAGTLVGTASAPLAIDPATGLITCATCVTSSGGGAITGTAPISVSAAGVVSINAPYVTLTASNGGIVYSGSTNLAVLAGTATARQMLQSGASAAPAWSTTTWPATTTVNRLLWSSSANVIEDLATANNGVLVTSAGGVPSISSTLPSGLSATNMNLTTPSIGVATGTSLALNGATIGSHAIAVTGTSAFSDVMLIGGGSQHINAKLDVTGATVTTGNDSFPFFVSANAPQGQTGFLLYNSATNHVDNKVLFGLQTDTTAGRNTVFSFSARFSDVNDGTRTSTVTMLSANNGSTTTAASLVGINWSFPGTIAVGSATATPAGGSTAVRLVFGTTAGFGIYVGSGAPTVSAAQGSLYLRSDGSSSTTRLYVNTNGSTTWTNVTTAL
jgi:hypothetical protein